MDIEIGGVGSGASVGIRHQQYHLMQPGVGKVVMEVGGGGRVVGVGGVEVPLVGVFGAYIADEFGLIVEAVGAVAQDRCKRAVGVGHIDCILFPALFKGGGKVQYIGAGLVYVGHIPRKLAAWRPRINEVGVGCGAKDHAVAGAIGVMMILNCK